MDTTGSPNSFKSQRLLDRQDASEDKDLISKLPEDILQEILMHLSTEEAIQTSILSKRWKDLWLYSPMFIFDDVSLVSSSINKSNDQILELWVTFFGSIERVLFLWSTSCLVNVCFSLRVPVNETRLESWLSAAVKRRVQGLILALPEKGEFKLPNSLSTSKSLRMLELEMQCTVKIPNIIRFSSLELLCFFHIVFQDDQSAQQLFSGCPLLEELRLCDCDWRNITAISIQNPSLRSLNFSDCIYPDHFPNAKIKVSALNLETLRVTGCMTVELLPCNLSSLKSASVDIGKWPHGDGEEEQSQQILKLLSGLQNVKSLNVLNETLGGVWFSL